jgi:flagellar export protein FliJ
MASEFPLASVLRFRESVEQREELALQKMQVEMARVRRAIEQADAEIDRVQQGREVALQNPTPAAHLQAMLHAAEVAKEGKKNLLATLHTLEQHRAEQMKAYQAAHQGRQMLSDLETRHSAAYERERNRNQQKRLDDLFVSRRQRG